MFGPELKLRSEYGTNRWLGIDDIEVVLMGKRGALVRRGRSSSKTYESDPPRTRYEHELTAVPKSIRLRAVTHVVYRRVRFSVENIGIRPPRERKPKTGKPDAKPEARKPSAPRRDTPRGPRPRKEPEEEGKNKEGG